MHVFELAPYSFVTNLKQDGTKIIGYREALVLGKLPGSMVIVGSGAIGSEFAHFYNTLGTKVTLVEFLPNVVPLEDEEVSKQLERSFRKAGMNIMTNSSVESADTSGKKCKVKIKTKNGEESVEADIILSAVGIHVRRAVIQHHGNLQLDLFTGGNIDTVGGVFNDDVFRGTGVYRCPW